MIDYMLQPPILEARLGEELEEDFLLVGEAEAPVPVEVIPEGDLISRSAALYSTKERCI